MMCAFRNSELREKVLKEGRIKDDFEEKSQYWNWRIDNYAGFELSNSILQMYMGPTEALYYSNAEISDGLFDDLLWSFKNFEAKIRLKGDHYGSAGWGFWNHSMVLDKSMPIWFIYLKSRGMYPFQGFFAQVGIIFQPIKIFKKNYQFMMAYLLSKFSKRLSKVKIVSMSPSMQDINLEEWHSYRIEWKKIIKFYIDGKEVASIPFESIEAKTRADVWIDNAVFKIERGDPGKVYRHATQENRSRAFLEIEYIEIS
ncbi:MAG: hypothetical protein QW755_00065 [Nitrososphaerota archaeon]